MIESLEARVLFSHAVDTSSVGLYNPDGSAAALDAQRDTWLIIHGLGSSKDDPTFQRLAQAVAAQSPDHQVLVVGWGALASAANSSGTIQRNALAVGDTVAAMLRTAGITGLHVNLIGFSMGGYVEDRIARDLHKVNRIVAIDPAIGSGFASHSLDSIAFRATMSPGVSLSARNSVEMTGLPGPAGVRHVESIVTFMNMMLRDAGMAWGAGDQISPLFSISNILEGKWPGWRKGSFHGFNATLKCGAIDGVPFGFEPLDLAYVNGARQVVHVV